MNKTINTLQQLYNQNLITARLYLKTVLSDLPSETDLAGAMAYAVYDGGKMGRSSLMMLIGNLYGLKTERILPAVAALEMIHNYSLVHDDLPALDNDDLRRGRPSCHKKFGEDIAILAGDGLLTMAFSEIIKLNYYGFEASQILDCIQVLSDCAGPRGMIMGQVLDLGYGSKVVENYNQKLRNIIQIHSLKTGMMFVAATKIAGILTDKTKFLGDNEEFVALFGELGLEIGKLFQVYDDIDDIYDDSGPNIAQLLQKEKLRDLILDSKAKIYQRATKLFDRSIFALESVLGDFDLLPQNDFVFTVAETPQLIEFIFMILGLDSP